MKKNGPQCICIFDILSLLFLDLATNLRKLPWVPKRHMSLMSQRNSGLHTVIILIPLASEGINLV